MNWRDIKYIFKPSWWIMLHRYSKQWDIVLDTLLDVADFEEADGYTAKIGGYTVWTANYPYAAFRPIAPGSFVPLESAPRPSRRTIERAARKLEEFTHATPRQ